MTDLEILQSLPSLYPLKDFEEEAFLIASNYAIKGGGWLKSVELIAESEGKE